VGKLRMPVANAVEARFKANGKGSYVNRRNTDRIGAGTDLRFLGE